MPGRTDIEGSIDFLAMISRRLREADRLLVGGAFDKENVAFENNLSLTQRFANWMADFSGRMPFLALNSLIFLVWIVINVELFPGIAAFAPYRSDSSQCRHPLRRSS